MDETKDIHENEVSSRIIGAAIEVHRYFGPGLIEQIYEESLCREFALRGIPFERQKPVPLEYKGVTMGVPLNYFPERFDFVGVFDHLERDHLLVATFWKFAEFIEDVGDAA